MVTMVGRDQDLATVLRGLADPEVALTLVLGEAGIGKSRLVAEAVAATPERLTLSGACLSMRHALPLLPIVDALDTSDPVGRRALTRAARSLPESLRPYIAGVMPRTLPEEIAPAEEVRRDRLILATEALLSRVAEERRLTFVVEDVHWADPDTLDLLTYLGGARRTTRLSVLVTCRLDETEMSEQVTRWLDTARRSAVVHEVLLSPLDVDDVRRLVSALPHPADTDIDGLASHVFARGEGNPFFTEQLVASVASGVGLPDRLAKLLSARVRAVSPSAREALTALAVLARPVPVAALRLVTQHTEEACLAAVRELESASLLARDDLGVRPRHALLAEALLAEQPGFPTVYHRRVADALESLNDPSTIPQVADHLQRAGDESAELRMAQLAAQRAWDLGGYADAARWYHRVMDLHAMHPEEPILLTEPELVRRTMRALDLRGSLGEAIALAERALHDYADGPNLLERLSLLSYCAQLVGIEDPARGQQLLEDLQRQYEDLSPHPDRAALLNRLASNELNRGDSRQALIFATQALGVSRDAGDLAQEAQILARLSTCSRRIGDRAAAEHHIEEAISTAERSADSGTVLFVLMIESDARLKYAEYEAAARAGRRGARVADQHGLQHSFLAQVLVANTAEAYLALGQTEKVSGLVDALTDQPLRPEDDVLAWLRAEADLRRGDPGGALLRLRRQGGIRPQGAEWTRSEAESLAYVLLWNHRPAEALDVAVRSLPAASVGDNSQAAGHLLSLAARATADLATRGDGSSTPSLARLDELLEPMALDPFADRQTLPRASADRRQWEAERTRAEGSPQPDAWIEAASAWDALSMPHDAAYCWWRAAEALITLGADQRGLRAALRAGHRLSAGHVPMRDEIGKLATQARIPILEELDADANPAGDHHLTAQETKVLRLLATGLTNAEIGTTLFISPKTVSVHVTRLLRKLEVSNRTEAAAWAHRHGLTTDSSTRGASPSADHSSPTPQ